MGKHSNGDEIAASAHTINTRQLDASQPNPCSTTLRAIARRYSRSKIGFLMCTSRKNASIRCGTSRSEISGVEYEPRRGSWKVFRRESSFTLGDVGVPDKSSLGRVGSKIKASIQRRSYLLSKTGQARTSSLDPKYSCNGTGFGVPVSAAVATSSRVGNDGLLNVLFASWAEP